MQIDDFYVKNFKFLDSKPYFASWEMDTFIVFSTFFGFALMLTTSLLPFSIIVGLGILSAWGYNQIKNSRVKGYFWHILYALGIKRTKYLPPSYMRYFLGA